MDLFAHVTTTYQAFREANVSHTDSICLLREHAAKLCLTDTIRCKLVPTPESNLVKCGRIYSHFTNGGYMRFPIECLKDGDFTPEGICGGGEKYTPSIADGPTNFGSFIENNYEMFKSDDKTWGLCTQVHLYQDVATDKVFQRMTANFGEVESGSVLIHGRFEATNKKVTYKLSGKETDGATFRNNIANANTLFHNFLVKQLATKHNVSKEEIEEVIQATHDSFDRYYDSQMAETSKGYLKPNPLWFTDETDPELERITAELIETGFCTTKEQLTEFWTLLSSEATFACDVLLNEIVFSQS
ncbi:hypothetical protein FWH09_00400 [Candidatus Saccharibacteria bacterium]|nr:hypothetical protein [Candidatus Saccharibacteria bacterium]